MFPPRFEIRNEKLVQPQSDDHKIRIVFFNELIQRIARCPGYGGGTIPNNSRNKLVIVVLAIIVNGAFQVLHLRIADEEYLFDARVFPAQLVLEISRIGTHEDRAVLKPNPFFI